MSAAMRSNHYHPAIKIFHWLVAVLVFAVWPLGFLFDMVKSGFHNDFYFWHASLGFTIFWLMLARLCVRFLTETPPKSSDTPTWQAGVAHLNQWLLYLSLISQPMIGFLLDSAHHGTFFWFGVIPIPSPLGKATAIAPTLAELHEFFAWTILVLVGLHICGALYSRIIRRDETLSRMT